MSSKSKNQPVSTEPDPNETATSTRKKTIPAARKIVVTMDIVTKGNHLDFINWRLDQLYNTSDKEQYNPTVKPSPTGYQVRVEFFDNKNTSKHFVARYLAGMSGEIRSLDESNLKIEYAIMPMEASVSTVVE